MLNTLSSYKITHNIEPACMVGWQQTNAESFYPIQDKLQLKYVI